MDADECCDPATPSVVVAWRRLTVDVEEIAEAERGVGDVRREYSHEIAWGDEVREPVDSVVFDEDNWGERERGMADFLSVGRQVERILVAEFAGFSEPSLNEEDRFHGFGCVCVAEGGPPFRELALDINSAEKRNLQHEAINGEEVGLENTTQLGAGVQ